MFILGWYQDLLLFVATPLLILPVIWGARSHWSGQEVYVCVAAFGALGHHLPGMMRAYGDRALFSRFGVRFMAAPVLLIALCGLFASRGWSGIELILATWGVWHGLMQTYGFLRIYDSKVGSFEKRTTRLDLAMCLCWFFAADLSSPQMMARLLQTYYRCGGPQIEASWIEAVRIGAVAITTVVTILFVVNTLILRARGRSPSPIKLLLMAITFAYWWFCRTQIGDLIMGIALFEVFHDVQYLSIVWVFNRNRARSDKNAGAFTRFLFRRGGALIGVYVGLVFAYGYLGFFSEGLAAHGVKDAFVGALAASTLLHFYFDGFIWKVREKATRDTLGLTGQGADAAARRRLPGWARHGLKWSLFVVPVAMLGAGEASSSRTPLERAEAVARSAPASAQARYEYGMVLIEAGRDNEARKQFDRALALREDFLDAHIGIGLLLEKRGEHAGARSRYEQALRFNPRSGLAHFHMGQLSDTEGDPAAAARHYERALNFDGRNALVHGNLGIVLEKLGRNAEAAGRLDRAIELDPDLARVHFHRGLVSFKLKDLARARRDFERAIAQEPGFADAHYSLGNIKLAEGAVSEAQGHFRAALQIDPAHARAHTNLGTTCAQEGKLIEAQRHFEAALRIEPGNAAFRDNMAKLEAMMAGGS